VLLIIAGISAFYLTRLLRRLAPRAIRERKPLSCNTCASFWLSLLIVAADLDGPWSRFWFVLPAAGISLLLLELSEMLAPGAPNLGLLK